uniref:Uncharacterized protein n=1 Tax=Arundo donax TaxID=35708 RepID=A0A0A9F3T3_ARUDO
MHSIARIFCIQPATGDVASFNIQYSNEDQSVVVNRTNSQQKLYLPSH